jgi:hypothetical protein
MLTTSIGITVAISPDEYIPWICPRCGTEIGKIKREKGIPKLDMLSDRGIVVIGDADVHCLKCGMICEWHYNQEALARLVKRILDNRKKIE